MTYAASLPFTSGIPSFLIPPPQKTLVSKVAAVALAVLSAIAFFHLFEPPITMICSCIAGAAALWYCLDANSKPPSQPPLVNPKAAAVPASQEPAKKQAGGKKPAPFPKQTPLPSPRPNAWHKEGNTASGASDITPGITPPPFPPLPGFPKEPQRLPPPNTEEHFPPLSAATSRRKASVPASTETPGFWAGLFPGSDVRALN